MAFLSLLATAVCILSALGLVVVGLFEAPWQVLLTGLLAALYGLQRVVQGAGEEHMLGMPLRSHPLSKVAPQAPPADPEPDKADKTDAPAASPPSATAATADNSVETYELTYRGIRYQVKKTVPTSESDTADSDTPSQPPDGPTEGIYRGQRWQR